MIFRYDRGVPAASSAPRGETWLHWGPPPPSSPGRTLSFQLAADGLRLTETHSEQRDISLKALAPGLWQLPGENLCVSVRPWHHAVALSELPSDAILIPFQGWWNGIWHDGIWQRIVQSQVTEYLAAGPGRLSWSDGNPERSPVSLPAIEGFWKASLIQSVRTLFREAPEAPLDRSAETATDALKLLILRLAFPQTKLSWQPPSGSPEAPQWKRLAQNLGIEVLRQSPTKLFATDWNWGNSETERQLLLWQVRHAPFVPHTLLHKFSEMGQGLPKS